MYISKLIPGLTIEQAKAEIQKMEENQYKYGWSIDRPRMWDLLYTIKQLTK